MSDSRGLVIVVMGVSGCGKSGVASLLAKKLSAHFKDADELHSPENIRRMSAGIALTDRDRQPWLESVAIYANDHSASGAICVVACSALKQEYRRLLNEAGNVLYVHLHGSPALIRGRMSKRGGHFMPEDLLDSQFATLEIPDPATESVITVDITGGIEHVVSSAESSVRQHTLFLSI